MITYSNEGTIQISTTPRVEFKQDIPNWFIEKFLNYMGRGKIRVIDYQGNELKVYYDSNRDNW
jgi:hypothetical protein